MKKCKYNIGLDIGTTSVGWAVVDCGSNKLIRKGNKNLWGVRLFEEGTTAATRRGFRSTRRRYDRRKERINLLRNEFLEEINKVDSCFFQKLNESFYKEDDEENKKITLTKDEKNQIKKYNEEYPTIYHLRKKLIETKEKMDIRLIYLAIHHIIKYRGNFLYDNKEFKVENLNIKEKILACFNDINTHFEQLDVDYSNIDFQKLEDALLLTSKIDKKEEIKKLLDGHISKNFIAEFIKLITGGKFSVNTMFSLDLDETLKISFKGSDFDDKYEEIAKTLNDKIEVLESLKELYDMIFLKELFKGKDTTNLSTLMVDRYNKHGKDLKRLKKYFKNSKELYKKVFKNKNDKKCIYEEYITNKISYDDFRKTILKLGNELFDKVKDTQLIGDYNQIKKELEQEDFLPRITDTDNGKYPYQLNKEELLKIIHNQGQYYPFLLNRLENGDYKLIRLLEFRIPYYVGPLNSNSDKSWFVRKEEGKITPYNFDQKVNFDASAEEFIIRMISHCTYLPNEFAMPNNSILYSKFKVLNELKQIKVNNQKLSNELQHKIYKELFLTNDRKITDKIFKNYLASMNEFSMYNQNLEVEGYSADNKFANDMSSYVDFFGPYGIFKNLDYTIENAEEIIRWITIFEDKDILKRKVLQKYPKITNENVKRLLNKKYSGWSNLSKKLLTEICYHDPCDSRHKSILTLMEETDKNFMQILHDKEYKFQEKIDELNNIDHITKINYELVENLATSPATKRGIYQALKVVEEIVTYIGYEPTGIMIEMARGDEKKQRKDDRKKYLNNLYDKSKKQIENYKTLKQQLNRYENINSQKLFLYFIQEGKSLYSGTPLNIENLEDYEIDHIIPQTLIKDDSLDNKALVLKEENQEKAANFVLPNRFRTNIQKGWWKHLKEINLISTKKYNNLMRNHYSNQDIQGFINRQLVETRQITKHVANIMKNYYKNTNVIYLHANLSHNYRERYELYKFRELNDFHHAHDAYLAAVLGEYKESYFKDNIDYNKMKELNYEYYKTKQYQKMKYGYVINSLDEPIIDKNTGEVIFDAEKFNKQVENTLYQNDILISKKTEIRTGEFFNQTVCPSKKVKKGFSLKKGLDIHKYGAYTSVNPSYAVVVKYTIKGKEKQRLIGIPIIIDIQSRNNPDVKIDYIKDLLTLGQNDTMTIVKDRIPFNIIINWDGQICSLVGATDKVEVCNAKEFIVDKEHMKKWKYSFARLLNNRKKLVDDELYEKQLNEILLYIIYKIKKQYKLYENLVESIDKICISNRLNIDELEIAIRELLNLLKFNSKCANLKLLNPSVSIAFGKKNGRIIEHASLIHKSITGIMEYHNEF